MLEIVLTPTMITFRNLDDEMVNKLHDGYGVQWSDKNGYFIKDNEKALYRILFKLTCEYDIELY